MLSNIQQRKDDDEAHSRRNKILEGLQRIADASRPWSELGLTKMPGFDWYIAPKGIEQMDDRTKETEIWEAMAQLRKQLKAAKPLDRSEMARRYAVTITELEKVMAYFDLWVWRASGDEE